jgi:hypothetical protein
VALGSIELLRLVVDPRPIDLVVLALVALVGLAAVREREDVVGTEGTRRTEAESFARILRGLARSVSPDAIVAAIVEELGSGTGTTSRSFQRRPTPATSGNPVLTARRPPRGRRCRCPSWRIPPPTTRWPALPSRHPAAGA